jgi:FlaA1/EpsC-like NDP-sugar epimerase/glycosyltransferase involved in cell wall biosynthesis
MNTASPRLVHIITDPMSFWLVQGQAAVMSRAGFDVHMISSPGAFAEESSRKEGVPFHAVPMARRIAPWSDVMSLLRLYGTLKRLRPRVVLAGTPKAGLLGTIAAWMLRLPVRVYCVHGLPLLTARGIRRLILRTTERLACAAATHVVCVGHSMRHELVRAGLCAARKATVLANGSANGVDVRRFNPARFSERTRQRVRSRLQIPREALVIGFVGRVVRDKGVCELHRAWRQLRERCPSAYLLVVGPPETTDPVPEEIWRDLANDPRVRMTGLDWNTPPLYRAMDLLCLPSHREGCPNVPMEAAAMELPVVAFRVPGMVDAVDDGVTGRLIEPLSVEALADALQDYLIDPAKRAAHGRAGRRRVVALFPQELVWAAIADFYASLAAGGAPRRSNGVATLPTNVLKRPEAMDGRVEGSRAPCIATPVLPHRRSSGHQGAERAGAFVVRRESRMSIHRVSFPTSVPLRRALVIATQLGLVVAANRIAFALRFDADEPAWALAACAQMLPWLIAIRGLTFAPFRLYKGLWRYTSVYDLRAILGAVVVSSGLFAVVAASPLGPDVYPRSIFIIDAVLLTMTLAGVRISHRLYTEVSAKSQGKRLLIVGAGDAGAMILRDMLAKPEYAYRPIGFIDDDPAKAGRCIHGIRVLGTRADVERILAVHRPDEVLIAIPSAEPGLIRAIVRALEPHKVPIKTLPRLRDIIAGKVELQQIRTLQFEDLLARPPVGLDPAPIRRLIAGRRVLVTGAGGTIGGELCRQIAAMGPASLVMVDRYENGLHAISLELQDKCPWSALHGVIGDISDDARVNDIFALYRPEIVFHAAAHKHVPLMEDSPCEAIKNNVTGSRILAAAAERHGVDRFIMISTDKAVNPISVMGASKRLAELVLRAQAAGSGTTFTIVRFGNVLGSNGSVVPRFLEQIRRGGPVTVTDPEVRRFFMLISEAVQLVLHAAAQATDGATYVLEMGEQVRLVDLARQLIRLSGFVPEQDIPITFVGLRAGEKLSEELVGDGETVRRSCVDKVLRVTEQGRPSVEVLATIAAVEQRAARSDAAGVTALLAALLPAYREARPSAVPRGMPREMIPLPFDSARRGTVFARKATRERVRAPVELPIDTPDGRLQPAEVEAVDVAVRKRPGVRGRASSPAVN